VMLTETRVTVSAGPDVKLMVAQSPGAADRALLVIHGGPDWDHTYLREPLVQLGADHQLIMPDLRGCGRSTVGLADGQYTPDAAVADLVALLDALGHERVDVLGFSHGGLLAQRLALAVPLRLRRLIIASSSLYPLPADAFHGWVERDTRLAVAPMRWPTASGLSYAGQVRADAIAQAPLNIWREDMLPAYLERLADVHFTGEWLRCWQKGILSPALPPAAARRLAALRIPVLILHGALDMIFPADLARRAADRIPGARAVIVQDAGHMTHVDQPGHWLAAVADFLAATAT
jgi:pimeloyl-ACP methyl ester carboxylesterase